MLFPVPEAFGNISINAINRQRAAQQFDAVIIQNASSAEKRALLWHRKAGRLPELCFGLQRRGVRRGGFCHSFIGFNAHNNQIAIAVFGNKYRFLFGMADVGNFRGVSQVL